MKNLERYLKATVNNAKTLDSYKRELLEMLDFINKPEEDITLDDLNNWKDSLCGSSATLVHKINSVKRYFTFLYELDIIEKNVAKSLKAPAVHNKEKKPLTADEVSRLIEAGKNPRDKAIISLMVSTGLRVSEMCNIKLDDVDGREIVITGKGNKQRMLYLNDKTYEYIQAYLVVRKDSNIDTLFVSNRNTKMAPRALNNTLKCLGKRAGIEDADRLHNHLMRCTNATMLLDNGVPVNRIQIALGHSNINTTMRYAKTRNKHEIVKETMGIAMF